MPLWIGQQLSEQLTLEGKPIVFEDARQAKQWLAARHHRRIWNAYARPNEDQWRHDPPSAKSH